MGLPGCPLVDRAAGGGAGVPWYGRVCLHPLFIPFFHIVTLHLSIEIKVMETKILLVLEQNWTKPF